MAWIDTLRQASYRGVAFFVESHDAKFGRRQVTHEFAGRDEPYTEDLGRRAREFSVDAYLVGDDYPQLRDQLIRAGETSGEGELVHPYLGNMQVVCTGMTVRENRDEGRMCRVQLTFVEAGQAVFPSNLADAVRSVSGAANLVSSAAGGGFMARFLTKGFPSFVVDSAAARVAGLSDFLTKLPVNPLSEAQAVATFFDRAAALAKNALHLVTSPSTLVSEVVGLVGSIRDVFGDRADSVLRSLRMDNDIRYSGPTNTPSRRQQQANQDALAALVRRAALAEEAKVAVIRAEESAVAVGAQSVDGAVATGTGLFVTREDAIAVRDELTTAIDVESEDPTTTTDEFQALSKMRAELVRGVPSPELRLPQVATVTPTATLPSLVVSYQIYATAGRAVEIAERNGSRHPGFLTGGEPLQVISDA